MKAVILAGGLGSRMGNVCENTPKPMLSLCGKPVLQYQIECLREQGIKDITMIVGYCADIIEEFFKDGRKFGVDIAYYREDEPLGTAGALFKLNLKEDFLLINGDIIFDFDALKMMDYHIKNNALITLFSHPNKHPYDSSLICANDDGRVTGFLSKNNKPQEYANLCNAGIEIISPEIFSIFSINGKADLDRDIIKPCVESGRVFSYKSSEYVKDMGTPERLKQVETDIAKGIVCGKRLSNLQKAVFLDRDGTVNVHKGYITKADDIELLDGVAQAISAFNDCGYLVIIVTNQPVIARGDCSLNELKRIHNRIETLLGEKGAYVDGIYYCPHHPDKGFEGEVEELKIQCNCRKPAPGLIFQAQKYFNIDLSKSYMVGDSIRDVQAAESAGCIPVLISEDRTARESLVFSSLLEFSEFLQSEIRENMAGNNC